MTDFTQVRRLLVGSTGAPLRAAPDGEADVLATIDPGTVLETRNRADRSHPDWVRVRVPGGGGGFVSAANRLHPLDEVHVAATGTMLRTAPDLAVAGGRWLPIDEPVWMAVVDVEGESWCGFVLGDGALGWIPPYEVEMRRGMPLELLTPSAHPGLSLLDSFRARVAMSGVLGLLALLIGAAILLWRAGSTSVHVAFLAGLANFTVLIALRWTRRRLAARPRSW